MSYDGQTPVLKLPQWVMSDQLETGDLNTAFSLLDDFAGTLPQAAGNLRSTSATGGWTPALVQDDSPIPFSYSKQQGWYALSGGFALVACTISGTALQPVHGTLQLTGLPCTPADGFPLTARLEEDTIEAYTQNCRAAFFVPSPIQSFRFACTGILPL